MGISQWEATKTNRAYFIYIQVIMHKQPIYVENKQIRFPGINLIRISWSHSEVTKGSSKCEN